MRKDTRVEYLCRLLGGQRIILGATTGQEFLDEAEGVFVGGISRKLRRPYFLNLANVATLGTEVGMYRLIKSGTFREILDASLIGSLCFTLSQVTIFAKSHRDLILAGGSRNFLPFKIENRIFVAEFHLNSYQELCLSWNCYFSSQNSWNGERPDSHCFFLPV